MIIWVERDTDSKICGGYSSEPVGVETEPMDVCDPEVIEWINNMPEMFRPLDWVCVPEEE